MADKKNKEEKEKSGKGKFIIPLLLVLIFAGAGTFAGVYYMKTHAASGPVEIEEAYYELADDFLVNLNDEGGKRYLKAKITVAYNSKDTKFGESLETDKAVLRDGIISYFKSKKAAEVNDPNNNENMKKELTGYLNTKLKKGQLTNVLFETLVVQ